MTDTKAIEYAEALADFCKAQRGCQNCVFRKHGADRWDCQIGAFDLREVTANLEAKRKNHGYI